MTIVALLPDEPIFIGAAPWHPTADSAWREDTVRSLPSTIWSAQLRQGFVGCLKNVRLNGINAQIAAAFLNTAPASGTNATRAHGTAVDGISVGCVSGGVAAAPDFCSR